MRLVHGSTSVMGSSRIGSSQVAIVFAGHVRGDARLWKNIREKLVAPNRADVFGAFWPSTAVNCFTDDALQLARGVRVVQVEMIDANMSAPSKIALLVAQGNATLAQELMDTRMPSGWLPQY